MSEIPGGKDAIYKVNNMIRFTQVNTLKATEVNTTMVKSRNHLNEPLVISVISDEMEEDK